MGLAPTTTRDVVALARSANPEVVRIVTDAGRALGEVLPMAVSLLKPAVAVIGGDNAHARERFLQGGRETLLQRG